MEQRVEKNLDLNKVTHHIMSFYLILYVKKFIKKE